MFLEWVLVSTSGRSFSSECFGLSLLFAVRSFLWMNSDRRFLLRYRFKSRTIPPSPGFPVALSECRSQRSRRSAPGSQSESKRAYLMIVFPSEWPRSSRCGHKPTLTLRAIVDKGVKRAGKPHIARIGMEGAFFRSRIAVCYRPGGRPWCLISIRFVPSNNQPSW
jgi:hypothetical protein